MEVTIHLTIIQSLQISLFLLMMGAITGTTVGIAKTLIEIRNKMK